MGRLTRGMQNNIYMCHRLAKNTPLFAAYAWLLMNFTAHDIVVCADSIATCVQWCPHAYVLQASTSSKFYQKQSGGACPQNILVELRACDTHTNVHDNILDGLCVYFL